MIPRPTAAPPPLRGPRLVAAEPAAWDRFIDASPQGTVFACSDFLRAAEEPHHAWLLLNEAGTPLAGVLVPLRDGQPALFPFTMYQGIFLPPVGGVSSHHLANWRLELFEILLPLLTQRHDRLALALHHDLDDLRGLQWFNYHTPERGTFRFQLRYTALLDPAALVPFDDWFRQLPKGRRQDWQKAEKAGLTVETSQDFPLLAELHRQTFLRQGEAYPEEHGRLVEGIARGMAAVNRGEMLLCRRGDGFPLSAVFFLWDRRAVYYLFGANHPESRSTGSGALLMIEAVRRWGVGGARPIDFVGINSPNRGDFKLGFNPRIVPYFEVFWQKGGDG
ncbi:MAG: GNAT family N-acetyltransferase [Magnetococcales bacterium]|nr:GNAT family N-acetyltransferase [Magnetococcales bacterium]